MSTRGEVSGARASAAALAEVEARASGARLPGSPGGDARGPLSEADFVALERAAARMRGLGRAVTLARVHAVSWFVCAVLSLPLALFDARMLALALAFAGCGAVELRGARLLRALDLRAPRWLGTHQLIVLAAIALYCAISIHSGLSAGSVSEEIAAAYPDLAGTLGGDVGEPGASGQTPDFMDAVDGAYRAGIVAFYLVVLCVSALYQGGCAYFHFGRARLLRAHLDETPRWVAELQRRLHGW